MNHGRLRTPKQGYLIPEHSAGILAKKNCHGLPGRTMGSGQGLVGRFDRKEGSQRKTPTGPSRGTQRDPVGMPDRGAMEGSPCPLSALPNVPSVLQSVVQCGCVGQGAVRLAQDLRDRGKIDITECFLDGTFASAKKGGVILDRLSEVKAPRSWPSQTLMVFLSPYGPSAPDPMK